MTIIGLTGNIASGKSTVAQYLKSLGAIIIDADEVAKEVVAPGNLGHLLLSQNFGPQYFNADASLNRKKLAAKVFADPKELQKLNELLHPIIIKKCKELLDLAQKQNPSVVYVLDAPLLIEVGLDKLVDEVWLVETTDDIRLARIMQRDGLSATEAKRRIKSQMPQKEKESYAKLVLHNNGTEEALQKTVDAAWDKLKN